MKQDNYYLALNRRHWYYVRHVPKRFAAFDERRVIRCSMRTTSVALARERRDAMVAADDAYWAALVAIGTETQGGEDLSHLKKQSIANTAALMPEPLRGYWTHRRLKPLSGI